MRNKEQIQKNPVCQDCKFHTSKPSTCNVLNIFVGRKTVACDKFKVKKGGK